MRLCALMRNVVDRPFRMAAFCLFKVIALVASVNLAQASDKELGRYLSSECTACHQITGRVTGQIPMIVAWPEDQFIAVMNAYKDRHREHMAMQTIAGKLSENEIAALASYFGGLALQPKIK